MFSRGGESDYTLVLVDGVRANAFGGGLDLSQVPLHDVERIEVLKGPQGTLYGRNSTAGAINVLSAAPSWDRESYVRFGYGAYETSDIEAMYNQPIGENLAVRFAGKMVKQDQGLWDSRVGENDPYAAGTYASTDPVVRDIGLTSEIYKLESFTVAGEREGTAKAEVLQRQAPNVKAVVSSGYAENPIVANYRSYGFCGFLNKPYRIDELKECLSGVLRKA